MGVGKSLGESRMVFVQELHRRLLGRGVDNELGVVFPREVRGVGVVKARRAIPDERGHVEDPRVLPEGGGDGSGHLGRLVQASPLGEIDLHGELVPFDLGKDLTGKVHAEEPSENHGEETDHDGLDRAFEGEGQGPVVPALEENQERALLPLLGLLFHTPLDPPVTHGGDKEARQNQ